MCLLQTGESREIYHFHYTTWPDFGVPESPASFLNFLFKVRESGSLGSEHGPSVVHCSAGIGRSGTFALVDTCLVLVRKWSGGGVLREYHQIHWQLKRNVAEKHKVLLLKRVKLWQEGKMRCDYTEWWIQGETLWHVGALNSRNNRRL